MRKGRHTVVSRPYNQRREHLETLERAISALEVFTCRVVQRRGIPVLRVMRNGTSLNVGCDFQEGEWWLVWADGRVIAHVAGIPEVVGAIVHELGG